MIKKVLILVTALLIAVVMSSMASQTISLAQNNNPETNKPGLQGIGPYLSTSDSTRNQDPLNNISDIPESTASISGYVFQANGALPLANAFVGVQTFYGGGTGPYTLSSVDGSYTINGLAPGLYRVKVYSPGFIRKYYKNSTNYNEAAPVKVEAAKDTPHIDFSLEPGGTISGHVYEADGRTPIADARVAIDLPVIDDSLHATTAGDGSYTINEIPSGNYRLYAYDYHPAHTFEYFNSVYSAAEATPVPVTAPENITGIDFTLETGGSISGHIYEADGRTPITEFGVNARLVDGQLPPIITSIPLLPPPHPGGAYSLAGLSPGQYVVSVSKQGYISEYYKDAYFPENSVAVTVRISADTPDIDFSLDKGGSISGRVTVSGNSTADGGVEAAVNTGAAAVPAQDPVHIIASLVEGNYSGTSSGVSQNGAYTINGLPTGNYRLYTQNYDYAGQYYNEAASAMSASLVPVIAPENTPDIDFNLAPAGSISGHIYQSDGITPAYPAFAEAINTITQKQEWYDGRSTDSTGYYQIRGLPEGDYLVRTGIISDSNFIRMWYNQVHHPEAAAPVTVLRGQETSGINFIMETGGAISGCVFDGATGEPVNRAIINIYNTNNNKLYASGYSATDGSYRSTGLPDGSYLVQASAYQYAGQWYDQASVEGQAAPVGVTVPDDTPDINFYPVTDKMPPDVSNTLPADKAAGIAVNSPIQITFSEPVNIDFVTGRFIISPPILGSFSSSDNVVSFIPAKALKYRQTYTVTLAYGIRDLADNILKSSYQWSFETGEGQVVTFPDPHLQAAIREAIDKHSGDIHQADLVNLTELNAGRRGITNLAGLEYCSGLQRLILYGNQITVIASLSTLTSLRELDLFGNQITDISGLANLVNLQQLGLDENLISSIKSLEYLSKLEWLGAGSNNIKDISTLMNLSHLRRLNLAHNLISDFSPLANVSELELLSLNGNKIADIDFLKSLTQLKWLYLGQNLICDISPLVNLVSLQSLDLSDNLIADITTLAQLTNLQGLSLENNLISNIAPLAGLVNLSGFSASYNRIADITALANLINLYKFDLSDNCISDISPLIKNTGLGKFKTALIINNYLDLTPGSADMLDIGILADRGATIIYSPQSVLPGDANGDGVINMGDVVQAERMLLGLNSPAPGADANKDRRLSIGDITRMERLILGLNTRIPLTIINALLSLVEDGKSTYIPYGSVIYHWSNGITEAFGPDKTRLWMARDSDAAKMNTPGGGHDVPVTFIYGVPNGSCITNLYENRITRVYLDNSLILTVIKSQDACQY